MRAKAFLLQPFVAWMCFYRRRHKKPLLSLRPRSHPSHYCAHPVSDDLLQLFPSSIQSCHPRCIRWSLSTPRPAPRTAAGVTSGRTLVIKKRHTLRRRRSGRFPRWRIRSSPSPSRTTTSQTLPLILAHPLTCSTRASPLRPLLVIPTSHSLCAHSPWTIRPLWLASTKAGRTTAISPPLDRRYVLGTPGTRLLLLTRPVSPWPKGFTASMSSSPSFRTYWA